MGFNRAPANATLRGQPPSAALRPIPLLVCPTSAGTKAARADRPRVGRVPQACAPRASNTRRAAPCSWPSTGPDSTRFGRGVQVRPPSPGSGSHRLCPAAPEVVTRILDVWAVALVALTRRPLTIPGMKRKVLCA